MDLLQEINNRIRTESSRVWNKVYDVAYDATVGLAKAYQRKALQLVKIHAASAYLQTLKVLRKHAILLFLAVFTAMLTAVAVVVVPVSLVLASSWTTAVKMRLLIVFGILDFGIAALCLQTLFSEEKWLKLTGLQEILDSIKTDFE